MKTTQNAVLSFTCNCLFQKYFNFIIFIHRREEWLCVAPYLPEFPLFSSTAKQLVCLCLVILVAVIKVGDIAVAVI